MNKINHEDYKIGNIPVRMTSTSPDGQKKSVTTILIRRKVGEN